MIDGEGMKINNIKNFLGITGAKEGKINKESRNSRVEKDSSVEITGKVKLISILKKAKEIPEVREELVMKLKESIENGTYQIDPEKIARKILGEES
ncbi:MAG: negative regulator of flagellin synthesis FlgM [Thermotogaceae bacterium]|jgi:negative regulator of flagellin synthesis FlgM|nr:negative regulator of flagellin synthesis FlgM [Thermotogaceae bacterium]MDN5338489.1 negative regulator of flagellin synthesis FlgM [Thermotogaceae bacterium]